MNFIQLMLYAKRNLSEEEYGLRVAETTSRGSISEKKLMRAVNKALPGSGLVVTDPEERRRRKEFQQRALNRMLELAQEFHQTALARAADPRSRKYVFPNMRVLTDDTTLDLPHSSQNEEYFRRCETLAKGLPREKAELVMNTIRSSAEGLDRSRLIRMNDEEVLENLGPLTHLANCAGAARSLAEMKDLELSDEERRELLKFEREYTCATWLVNRISAAATKGYSAVRIERLAPFGITGEDFDLPFEEREVLSDICNTAISYHAMAVMHVGDEVVDRLEGNACDRIVWADEDGNELSPVHDARSNLPGQFEPPLDPLFEGKYLTAKFPDGRVKAFSFHREADGSMPFRSEPLHAMMDAVLPKQMTALAKELDDVDPWYLHSSGEFKAVKSQLDKTRKAWRAFHGTPTAYQRERLRKQMQDLNRVCRDYLSYKLASKNPSERETRRVKEVEKILQFADRQIENIITLDQRAAAYEQKGRAMQRRSPAVQAQERERQQQRITENIRPFENVYRSREVQAAGANIPVCEFTSNKALIEKVGMESDPNRLQEILDGKDNVPLKPEDRDFLNYRIDRLNAVRKFEQNLPEKQLSGRPEMRGNALWLSGVTQPHKQKTWNGCWSVSLQSQLAFRGINVDQATLRAMRPQNQSNRNEEVPIEDYNKDRMQTVSDYSNLVQHLLPNTAVHTVTLNEWVSPDPKVRGGMLRDMVTLAMQKHQSPVSIVFGGHYRTIFGMDDKNIYVKNPQNADPAHCEAISISTVENAEQVQLTWLQDLKPTLSGGTPLLGSSSIASGTGYNGGNLLFNEQESIGAFETQTAMTEFHTAAGRNVKIESYLPDRLKYRRPAEAAPGDFALNLDALQAFGDRIAPLVQRNEAYRPLQTALDDMLHQPQTTHENLHALAQAYHSALKISADALRQNPADKTLAAEHKLLTEQTQAVRGSLQSYLNFQSQKLIHDPMKSYRYDPTMYADVENGMVAMLHDATAASLPIEDARWLTLMGPGPEGRARSLQQFRHQPDVEKMLSAFKEQGERELSGTYEGPRTTVELKSALRGGDVLPLVREYTRVRGLMNRRPSVKENEKQLENAEKIEKNAPQSGMTK